MQYVQPILDLFYNIVDRIGTKAAITCGVDYALIYLLIQGKISEQYGVIGLVVVTVGFFVQRVSEKKIESTNGGTTPAQPPTI